MSVETFSGHRTVFKFPGELFEVRFDVESFSASFDAFDVRLFDGQFDVEKIFASFDAFDVRLFDERFVAEQFSVSLTFPDPPGSHTRFSEISFIVRGPGRHRQSEFSDDDASSVSVPACDSASDSDS